MYIEKNLDPGKKVSVVNWNDFKLALLFHRNHRGATRQGVIFIYYMEIVVYTYIKKSQ